jgi:hypothetical protein
MQKDFMCECEQSLIMVGSDLSLPRAPERDERFADPQACDNVALPKSAELKKLEKFFRGGRLSFTHGK